MSPHESIAGQGHTKEFDDVFAMVSCGGKVGCMSKNPDKQARESLTRLMNDTELFAKRSMREKGCITARLYIHGEYGTQTLLMKNGKIELSKRDFVVLAKIACIAVGGDASVFVSEAWMLTAIPGESPVLPRETRKGMDNKEVVMESKVQPDARLFEQLQNQRLAFQEQVAVLQNRREVVMLMGETLGYGEQRIMPMQRSSDGKFMAFAGTQSLQGNRFRGEFANFVSHECRDARQQSIARQILAKHGISFGSEPRQRTNREERGRGMEHGM